MRFKRKADRERFGNLTDFCLRLYGVVAALDIYTWLRWRKKLVVSSAGEDWIKIDSSTLKNHQWKQVLDVYYNELDPLDGDQLAIRDDYILIRLTGSGGNGNGEVNDRGLCTL